VAAVPGDRLMGGTGPAGWRRSSACNTNSCVEVWVKSSYSSASDCVEVAFVKSSYSGGNGCVEVGVAKKSSHSTTQACVEVEGLPEGWVAVRDNERPGEMVQVSPESWRAFVAGVKDGEFDLA
jgi:hypothetical protein